MGGSLTTGSISLGGNQTTGDINIGTNATSDIYLGNATNATAGTNVGVCHINKAQAGTNGSVFREMRFGVVSGGSGSGSVSFTPAMTSTPTIFTGGLQSTNAGQVFSIQISTISTTGFSYIKVYIAFVSGSSTITGAGGASGESFSWMAISA